MSGSISFKLNFHEVCLAHMRRYKVTKNDTRTLFYLLKSTRSLNIFSVGLIFFSSSFWYLLVVFFCVHANYSGNVTEKE